MASGNHISCGPCMFDDVKKDAARWCNNCEEGLCEDCENVHRKGKTTRNHQVISIEDYRKIENLSISQVCEHHGENLEWFCKSHEEALCVVCVPSKHKACSDVIPISANSANSRQSTALLDLEVMTEGTLRNIAQCIKNRESATKELEIQELAVKTMVHETRTKINRQLDRLQEKLLQELKSTTHTCKSKYMEILRKLKSTDEMLAKLREQTIHMKQFSSDIQVFLGTRQVNKQVRSLVESIKNEISVTKDYNLKMSIDGLFEKLSNEVEEFGKIMISESATNLDFRDQKFDQAQIQINIPTSRNIHVSDIKLHLIQSFQTKRKSQMIITGCVILPNGHLLMANSTNENQLIEYSDTGEHIRDIQVSTKPFDIDVIDPDRIVVTYGVKSFLEIMNCNTFYVEKKINLQKCCYGVSHEDGKLYVANRNGVLVIDLSGKEMKTLKDVSEGFLSHNLTIIQHDGKDSKTLLTETDGLKYPKAVYFDKDTKTLLICNRGGKVSLYKVI